MTANETLLSVLCIVGIGVVAVYVWNKIMDAFDD